MADVVMNEESIKQKATFYEKSPTEFQTFVNQASIDLCMKNPSLLLGSKGVLLQLARDKVHEDGYTYKKGKSRSIKHGETSTAPKRAKVESGEGQRRINEIQEDIADIDSRIQYKKRRVEAATSTRSFKTCDEVSEEISHLKK